MSEFDLPGPLPHDCRFFGSSVSIMTIVTFRWLISRQPNHRVLVWALAGLLVGCGSDPPFQPLSSEEVAAAPPVLNIRAIKLQEKHRVTPHATNRELAGKVIEVEGLVAAVGRQPTGQWFITLHGGAKDKLPIQCFIDEVDPWKRVSPGMVTILKGQWMKNRPREVPRLLHGVIVSVDEVQTPGKRLTAIELCRRYADNHALAQNDFLEQWAWVTGRISTVDRVNGYIYLEGLDNTLVQCRPISDEQTMSVGMTSGQTVLILGKVMGGDQRQIILRECLPPEILSSSVSTLEDQAAAVDGKEPASAREDATPPIESE
jgi:hypothetical protein